MPSTLGVVASGKYNVWTPAAVLGLMAWYDAADAATLTYFSGALVSQWNDKSGAGANATADSSANAPTLVAAAINSKPAMSFAPGGVMRAPVSVSFRPVEMFVAVKTGPITGGKGLTGSNGGNGGMGLDHNAATMRLMAVSDAQVGAASSPFTANTPTVFGVSFDAGGVWTHYRDGVPTGTGTNAYNFTANRTLALGGTSSPASSPYDGYAGEYLIYNRVLTSTERGQVNAYLRTKWGTP